MRPGGESSPASSRFSGPASANLYGRSPIGKGTGLQNPLLKVRLLPAVLSHFTCGCRQEERHQASTLTRAGSIPASRSFAQAQHGSLARPGLQPPVKRHQLGSTPRGPLSSLVLQGVAKRYRARVGSERSQVRSLPP